MMLDKLILTIDRAHLNKWML